MPSSEESTSVSSTSLSPFIFDENPSDPRSAQTMKFESQGSLCVSKTYRKDFFDNVSACVTGHALGIDVHSRSFTSTIGDCPIRQDRSSSPFDTFVTRSPLPITTTWLESFSGKVLSARRLFEVSRSYVQHVDAQLRVLREPRRHQ